MAEGGRGGQAAPPPRRHLTPISNDEAVLVYERGSRGDCFYVAVMTAMMYDETGVLPALDDPHLLQRARDLHAAMHQRVSDHPMLDAQTQVQMLIEHLPATTQRADIERYNILDMILSSIASGIVSGVMQPAGADKLWRVVQADYRDLVNAVNLPYYKWATWPFIAQFNHVHPHFGLRIHQDGNGVISTLEPEGIPFLSHILKNPHYNHSEQSVYTSS